MLALREGAAVAAADPLGERAGDEAWYANSRSLVEEDESFEEPDGIGDEAWAGNTRGGVLIGDAGITVELGISADPGSHDVTVDALERVEANY